MRHRTTNSHLVSLSFGSRLCESEVSGYYANELCARLKLALAHLHKRIKWFKARHVIYPQEEREAQLHDSQLASRYPFKTLTNYDHHSWSRSSEEGFCRFPLQFQQLYFVEGSRNAISLASRQIMIC